MGSSRCFLDQNNFFKFYFFILHLGEPQTSWNFLKPKIDPPYCIGLCWPGVSVIQNIRTTVSLMSKDILLTHEHKNIMPNLGLHFCPIAIRAMLEKKGLPVPMFAYTDVLCQKEWLQFSLNSVNFNNI